MHRSPANRAPSGGSVLRWLCWLPLASLVIAESYVRQFDGWGAWASAPILLLPGLISLAIAIPALLECVAGIRAGRLRPAMLLYTGLAGLPLLWLGVRRFLS